MKKYRVVGNTTVERVSNIDEARNEAQTLWDLQEIVLTPENFTEMEVITPKELDDINGYEYCPVYNEPEEDADDELDYISRLESLLGYNIDMMKESCYSDDHEYNPWRNDKIALEWAIKKLKGLNDYDF